jgi:repressor LexA
MLPPLSLIQRRTLNQLQKLRAAGGYEPSYRELAKSLGLASPASVHVHLKTLETKGYLRRDEHGRLVPIMGVTHAAMTIPIRWRIINVQIEPLAEQELYSVPASLVGSGEHSLYLMADNSYRDMHIISGDYLVVEDTMIAKNNDTVITSADNRTVIRRFFRENNTFRLQALDPSVPPLLVPHVKIIGVIRGVIRKP